MSNHTLKTSAYEALFVSIESLYQTQENISIEKQKLTEYSVFLSQLENVIRPFECISNTLITNLTNYDFAEGFQFEEKQKHIAKLFPLKYKLMNMEKESNKLSVLIIGCTPKNDTDRYGDLVEVISKTIGLSEIDQVTQIVEIVTQKIVEIQDVLNRTHIYDYCNRYNKDNVLNNLLHFIQNIATYISSFDEEKITRILDDILRQINEVTEAFKNEKVELKSLQKELLKSTKKTFSPELWKETNECLLNTVNELLKKDTEKEDFNLQELQVALIEAKQKRLDDIANTITQYPWVIKKRYKNRHDKIVSSYVTSIEYQKFITECKKERTVRIILACIPLLGWIILLFDNIGNKNDYSKAPMFTNTFS